MPQPTLVTKVLTKGNYLRAKLTDSTVLEEVTPAEVLKDIGGVRHETRIPLTAPGVVVSVG